MKLSYIIAFVSDMDAAVRFHRDTLGLTLRFQSPGWSEFETGSTTLALHLSSETNRPGTMQLGLQTEDLQAFAAALALEGLRFTREPREEHGSLIAEFADRAGGAVFGRCSGELPAVTTLQRTS
jgi:catechol 2,3-dioxygenase-like lactoylglutathione lyase family enzyme